MLNRVRESGALSPVEFEPAFAIKFTIARENGSGTPGDGDLFGSQHYAPLIDIPIPERVGS